MYTSYHHTPYPQPNFQPQPPTHIHHMYRRRMRLFPSLFFFGIGWATADWYRRRHNERAAISGGDDCRPFGRHHHHHVMAAPEPAVQAPPLQRTGMHQQVQDLEQDTMAKTASFARDKIESLIGMLEGLRESIDKPINKSADRPQVERKV